MNRREIASDEWRTFFESFNGQHEGWLIDIERIDNRLNQATKTRHRNGALRSVRVEESVPSSVTVAVDDTHTGCLETERITAPHRVVLEQTENGIDAGLEIEGAESSVRVRFRSPMPPVMVDGMPVR